jgi:hypothetical protein|uniref:hypothetical protein n=1 Tax=Candidatus Planktophila sp. TaxID=2175601 RepID=UPI00404A9AE4
MREITPAQHRMAYLTIAVGVLLGIFGLVRIGALAISLGTAVIAFTQWNQRKFDRYMPLAIAVVLFGLALALPKGL